MAASPPPTRAVRRLLFLALLLMAPLPLAAAVANGLMPVARMWMLAGACLGVLLVEGGRGAVGLILALLGGQAALYTLVLFGVAALAARGLARLPGRARWIAPVALVLAGAVLTASVPVYHTPFRADAARSTLLEVFE